MKNLASLLLLLLPMWVWAAEVSWTYEVSNTDCAGDPIEIVRHEAYISSSPIPAADEPCSDPTDSVPEDAQRVEVVPDTRGKVTLDLPDGEYYIRGRVLGDNGFWSNLSNQLQIVVVETEVEVSPEPDPTEPTEDPVVAESLVPPQPVRKSPHDWRCIKTSTGEQMVHPHTGTMNFQRENIAIFVCNYYWLQDGGTESYDIEGGQYRMEAVQ